MVNAGVTYSSSPKGFWFGGNSGVFLLALGSRNQSSTTINNPISSGSDSWAFYWSRTPSGATAKGLNASQGSNSAIINTSWARADGRTIRCVKR
jgi:hypothetical protein